MPDDADRTGIKVRSITEPLCLSRIDTSTGLSYNGTTHDEVNKGTGFTEPYLISRFAEQHERLTAAQKKAMVDYQDAVLALLDDENKDKARRQIAKWQAELTAAGFDKSQ